ncbi:MAG: zinc metalloprotease HtpX [Desulfomonilaceae bacterium]
MNRVFVQHAVRNIFHSVVLMACMLLVCAMVGWVFWGVDGLVYFSTLTVVGLFISLRISPRLIFKMYGAVPIREEEAPHLLLMMNRLAQRAGLPKRPQLYYIPSQAPNAFAVGSRRTGAIAITEGLLNGFTPRELQGVLAHEMGHLRRNDGFVMSLAVSAGQLVSIMSWIGKVVVLIHFPFYVFGGYQLPWLPIIILVFAPPITALLQLALSRTREFEADFEAARSTGDPIGLASALQKLEGLSGNWFERLFLQRRKARESFLFWTHPPTEERIRRLLELERSLD